MYTYIYMHYTSVLCIHTYWHSSKIHIMSLDMSRHEGVDVSRHTNAHICVFVCMLACMCAGERPLKASVKQAMLGVCLGTPVSFLFGLVVVLVGGSKILPRKRTTLEASGTNQGWEGPGNEVGSTQVGFPRIRGPIVGPSY